MAKSKSSPKPAKEAPFSKFQALVIFLLLVITGALLIHHTTTSNNNSDPWTEILTEYKCAHHNDIPANLSDGSTGGCVKFAQFLLEVGADQFHVLGDSYDTNTKAQVMDFQQKAGLAATGNLDQGTWAKLEGCVNLTASATNGVWNCQKIKAY